jgi:CRISPR/Cas system-associated exonuclease Cas4 (RecB family)
MNDVRTEDESLTPKQDDVRKNLLGRDRQRLSFPGTLQPELVAQLEDGLTSVAATVPDASDPVRVSKYDLHDIMICEGLYRARLSEPFAWSIHNVRGTLIHRAIQRLVVSGYVHPPLDLVEEAFCTLREDNVVESRAAFLCALTQEESEDLIGDAADQVTKFLMDWPKIPRSWLPRVESKLWFPLLDGRIVLSGRTDLALGRPRGNQAGTFVVDLKSARQHGSHIQEARYYALLETLVRGTPPFRIGIYYVDSGTHIAEDVTVEILESQVRRVINGVTRIREVQLGQRPPVLSSNPLCEYCPALADCPTGQEWLLAPR